MKVLIVLTCLLVAAFAANTYDFDENFDLVQIASNDALLVRNMQCFLDKAPCSTESSKFKKVLPEIVATSCAKCSVKQKANTRKLFRLIQAKHISLWDDLMAKYDSKGTHRESFYRYIQS